LCPADFTLERRLKEIDRQAEKMIAAYKSDIISMDELAKDKAIVDAERKSIEHEQRRLEELRDNAVWYDADSLMAEAEELRVYMPFMNDDEKAILLDRVYLKGERRLNDEGEQVVWVECRLGSTTLRLPPPKSSLPSKSSPNGSESTENIDSSSYSSR
jgi:hypothetical protein